MAPIVQPNIRRDVLLQALYMVYPSTAAFTVVPGFQLGPSVTLSTDSTEPRIPKPLSSLYYRKYCTMFESGFKAAVEDIQINITASKAEFFEKATKGQSSTCIWYDHRIGRITAFMMGKVANVWRENFLHHL